MTDDLVTLAMQDDFAMGTWRNVMIMSWRKGVSVAALRRLDALGDQMHAKYPQGYASMSISIHKTPMPDEASRKLGSELMKKAQGRMIASVNIIEGSGFWASTARSVVAAMNFAAQIKYPLRVTATIEEGTQWLGPELGLTADDVVAFTDVCLRFRAQHGAVPVPAATHAKASASA
jgi:hypothetical protein